MDKKTTIILVILAIIVVAIFVYRARISPEQPTPAPEVPGPEVPTPEVPEITPELEATPTEEVVPEETPTEEVVPEETEVEAGVREIVVEGSEFFYNPSEIRVSAGENVRLVLRNIGAIPHDLKVEGPGIEIRTRLLNPGEEDAIEFTVPESGVLVFYCTVPGHREQGMEGSLVVE